MDLYRVLPLTAVEELPKKRFFQSYRHLTERRRRMAEQLASEIEDNGFEIDVDGKLNSSSLPPNFYVLSHILHSVGAGRREKEWKKFVRFLGSQKITPTILAPSVRKELRKFRFRK
jgi:hypothetical protein